MLNLNKDGLSPCTKLYAPVGYWEMSEEEKSVVCNGMGAKDSLLSPFIPNTFLGLDMSEAGNIHDYMYLVGVTYKDKEEADRVFLNNMLRIIQAEKDSYRLTTYVRRRIAWSYYTAVVELGSTAYWEGKNGEDEEKEIS